MHPLAPDLSGLSLDELNKKYNELTQRYIMASRSGSGSVLSQMVMLLDDYKSEISRRHQKILDDTSNKNPNFKNIIDIK
jgi:hypothetical protein